LEVSKPPFYFAWHPSKEAPNLLMVKGDVLPMTEEEKTKIHELREQGLGYKRIAAELGMKLSSIQSFIKRNKAENQLLGTCKECGMQIKSTKGKKRKEFCSDRCRMRWWNAHRDSIKHRNSSVVKCRFCGVEFITFGNCKRVYCSHECYVRDRRGRSDG